MAEALLSVHRQVSDLRIQDGALLAQLPVADARELLRELLTLAQVLRTAEEEEETRARHLRRTLQPPIRPLRDRSRELDAPPPLHPLHAARWRKILRQDRQVALGLGIPLLPLSVGLVWFQAPRWTLVCPGCGTRVAWPYRIAKR